MSKGEEKIAKILALNGIQYEREKSFVKLRNGKLRFDFFIPSINTILEYDGRQHFV